MLEVIETIKDVTKGELKIDFNPKQKGDMRDTYADTSAARTDLGYAPSIDLRQGLVREWEGIREL